MYKRYRQPVILIIVKAIAEVARMADKPKAAANICTKVPVPMPKAATDPALKPCPALRPIMYKESGPGIILRTIPETINNQRSVTPNIAISLMLLSIFNDD